MTSFVHIDYPQQHPGVARAEAVIEAAGRMRRDFDGTRGIAALLLGAVVAALLVLADRLVESWAGGRLMAAWIVLWLVAFAAIALFAAPARRLAGAVVGGLNAWSARVAQRRADERLWATAQVDARVMADLRAAMARSEGAMLPSAAAAALRAAEAPNRRSLRQIILQWHRDVRNTRTQVAMLMAAEKASRSMAGLSAGGALPQQTQTLLRADQASAALRDAAHALGARHAGYYQ
ncbi:hypothetical protein [Pseudorhodoferax sp.]|uniref:hypothetical protein n=1 Tax=Pseudorhodoferax sp. TaxID=1993553 RepID=UPI0039E2475F